MAGRSSATKQIIRSAMGIHKETPRVLIFAEEGEIQRMGARNVRTTQGGGISFELVSVNRMTRDEKKNAKLYPLPDFLSD